MALLSVFPPYPQRKEFDIWATMHMAKKVGGDFYDFYFVDEDTLAFLIADVSGKATKLNNEMYGEDRLIETLNQNAYKPQTICDAVKADVDAFVDEASQFDDITMLCLEYKAKTKISEEEAN